MLNDSDMLIVLLCLYYQEGKKLGEDTVRIGSNIFKLIVSDDPVEDEPGVSIFRISPMSALYKYIEMKDKNNGEV